MTARVGLWIASRGRERCTLVDADYDRGVAILGLNGVAHSVGAAATYEPPHFTAH